MTIKDFLNLVEIRTKVASLFPFLFGTLYALRRYGEIDGANAFLMFASLLLFDMTTTAVNNYVDYVKSVDREYKRKDNVIGAEGFSLKTVRLAIGLMGLGALFFGLLLFVRTGPAVLILGGLSFAVGILYTAGPVPVSRLPLGEVFSGFFMGFLIPYLAVYIHRPSLLLLSLEGGTLLISLAWKETGALLLASLPLVFSISNIMLANNICDLEQDIRNRRYPLPHFIGIPASLKLYRFSLYAVYLAAAVGIAAGILPVVSLVFLVSFPLTLRNTANFVKMPSKEKTFSLAPKNMMIIGLFYTLPLAAAVLFSR